MGHPDRRRMPPAADSKKEVAPKKSGTSSSRAKAPATAVKIPSPKDPKVQPQKAVGRLDGRMSPVAAEGVPGVTRVELHAPPPSLRGSGRAQGSR